jgi:hypothetical protein
MNRPTRGATWLWLPSGVWAVLVAGSFAAQDPATDSTEGVAPVPSQLELGREQLRQLDEERWHTEMALGETEPALARFFTALRAGGLGDGGLQGMLFREGFVGSSPPEFDGPAGGAGGAGELVVAPRRLGGGGAPAPLERESFAAAWTAYASGFGQVARTEYHVSLVEHRPALEGGWSVVRLTGDARVTGGAPGGLVREDQWLFSADAAWSEAGGGPVLVKFDLVAGGESLRGAPAFRDVTERVGFSDLGEDENLGVAYFAEGVSMEDADGDGDLDLFVPRRYGAAALLANDGMGNFTDVAEAEGIGRLEGARCGYFFDWDNDGDLDLLVQTASRMFLFTRADGRFDDRSAESGFQAMTTDGLTGAAVADYDRDGWLDFYVANYGNPHQGPGYGYFDSRNGYFNKLFRNRGDGTFEDATDRAGLGADNRRWTYAVAWADTDGDGWSDLYVVNDYGPNQLFRNRGDGTFEDVTARAGAGDPGNGMGVSWGDLDGDGLPDLYVSNMQSYAGMRITRSPGFRSEASARALRFAKGNTWLRNLGDGTFTEVGDTPLTNARWAWGQSLLDYDNDGDLDVYVANGMFSNREKDDL